SSYILKLEASGSRLVGFPPDTQPFTAPPWLYPALGLGPRSKGRFNRLRSKNLNPSVHNSSLIRNITSSIRSAQEACLRVYSGSLSLATVYKSCLASSSWHNLA